MEKRTGLAIENQTKREISVLRFLQKNGDTPRVELSKQLKLTKAAITSITNDMINSGLLLEKGEQLLKEEARQRGRRKILLGINENYKLVFGISIDSDDILVGLTNLKGQPLDKMSHPLMGKSYRDLLELIVALVTLIMKNNCITNENLLGIGICIGEGCGEAIEGARTQDKLIRLKKDLSHALPIKLATAEMLSGAITAQRLFAMDNTPNMLMLRYSQFAQSAVLINGKNYMGASGKAGGLSSLLKPIIDEEELTIALAQAIIICNKVLDTEKIYCFGSYFENMNNRLKITEVFLKQGFKKLMLNTPMITDAQLYLAPCATAVDSLFFME